MPKTSILFTDAANYLGTHTVLRIAKLHYTTHHLLLAVQDPHGEKARQLGRALNKLGDGVTYAFVKLNLLNLAQVRDCVEAVSLMLDHPETPPLGAIVNCEERIAFVPQPYTVDGFHPIYQANYLGPWLLTTGLIGKLVDGGRVVNMGDSSGQRAFGVLLSRKWGEVGHDMGEGHARGAGGVFELENASGCVWG
ncbi:MAG: hypothetical protein M1839_008059 [Geoglossum umbratile]|nr:MAG: hypothetical protein M1839_008059 [Geoglossum umbratile]